MADLPQCRIGRDSVGAVIVFLASTAPLWPALWLSGSDFTSIRNGRPAHPKCPLRSPTVSDLEIEVRFTRKRDGVRLRRARRRHCQPDGCAPSSIGDYFPRHCRLPCTLRDGLTADNPVEIYALSRFSIGTIAPASPVRWQRAFPTGSANWWWLAL